MQEFLATLRPERKPIIFHPAHEISNATTDDPPASFWEYLLGRLLRKSHARVNMTTGVYRQYDEVCIVFDQGSSVPASLAGSPPKT